MKKSIFYIGMALVLLTNVLNASNKNGNQEKLHLLAFLSDDTVLHTMNAQTLLYLNCDSIITEVIKRVNINKKEKTADELIAEDNMITENNISNETMVLDFNVIDQLSKDENTIEIVHFIKKEKTADELIAEDNAITENNISNAIQPLDFTVINKKLIHVFDNRKSSIVIY